MVHISGQNTHGRSDLVRFDELFHSSQLMMLGSCFVEVHGLASLELVQSKVPDGLEVLLLLSTTYDGVT